MFVNKFEQVMQMPVQFLLPCCKRPATSILCPEMAGERIDDEETDRFVALFFSFARSRAVSMRSI